MNLCNIKEIKELIPDVNRESVCLQRNVSPCNLTLKQAHSQEWLINKKGSASLFLFLFFVLFCFLLKKIYLLKIPFGDGRVLQLVNVLVVRPLESEFDPQSTHSRNRDGLTPRS